MRKVTVRTKSGIEVRYYLTEEEANKYRQYGFNVKEGPRGGHYILETDFIAGKRRLRERREKEQGQMSREKELDSLLGELKTSYALKHYKEALSIVDEIKEKYMDLLDDEEREYLYKIEDRIIKNGSKDILGIELCKSVDESRKEVYQRICRRLNVLSNFRKIDKIEYLGKNKYRIKLGSDIFEVEYKKNGTASEIWYYDNGKKYKGRAAIVRWLKKSQGKELENVWNAFAKTYGTKKKGNKEIINIKRKGALVKKIEKVTPVGKGKGKRIKWLLFVLVKAKELGIAVKDMNDVIKLLNSEGIRQLIMEMFSITLPKRKKSA